MCGDKARKHGESVKRFVSYRSNVETEYSNTEATICTVAYKAREATKQLWNKKENENNGAR
jgi:hypothetical protein